MTTQITTTENKQVAIAGSQTLSASGLDVSDLKPTYLSLAQKMSDTVEKGICEPGDIIETQVNVVHGGNGKPVEVLPIFMKKQWQSFFLTEKGKKEKKPFRKEWYGPSNSHWKYDDILDGRKIKNDMVVMWHVLPVGDGALPCIISFRGMSGRAGSGLTQIVARLNAAKKPAYAKTIKLDSIKESNDEGTYSVFTVAVGRDANPKELEDAKMWQDEFNKKVPAPIMDDEAVPF